MYIGLISNVGALTYRDELVEVVQSLSTLDEVTRYLADP